MNRILTIAETEFLTLVRTKAFIIGILLVPVLMAAFITFMNYAEDHVDTTDRVDRGDRRHRRALRARSRAAAAKHNTDAGSGDDKTEPHFCSSRVDPAARSTRRRDRRAVGAGEGEGSLRVRRDSRQDDPRRRHRRQ